MRQGQFPPQSAMRPWYGVGELVRDVPARIPRIDPAEDVGAVGQPETKQRTSGFEPYRVPSAAGLPAMPESTLIRAHRHCTCCQEEERMPWESWSEGQRQWFERRQRVMARREIQREARAAQKAGTT
jgi:hypothetical protein